MRPGEGRRGPSPPLDPQENKTRLPEHGSKQILQKYRIPLPAGRRVGSGEPLTIDGPVMLKAQMRTLPPVLQAGRCHHPKIV